MAFASNQGPDLFSSCKVEKNRAAGNIISFEDIEGGKEWIAENYNEEDYKNNSEFMGDDGKIYTLPNSILTFGLVSTRTCLKKYGIVDENGEPTPPETFDQVREYAKDDKSGRAGLRHCVPHEVGRLLLNRCVKPCPWFKRQNGV